jgi:hypothetical protein
VVGEIVAGKGRKPIVARDPFASALMLSFFSFLETQASPKVQFSIIYTNDVMGEVEPCG